MTARSATFLGIGSMVGAGIFSLLGEAGAVAGSAVWVSFLVGGIVAGLLGYVCSKLGMRYPSSGGLVAYLQAAYGKGRIVGTAAWLGYIAAVVIVTAMIAVSFGSYATSLFVGDKASSNWDHLFITLLLIGTTALNVVGTRFVTRAQALIVSSVLVVFGLFVWVTVTRVNWDLLAPSGYPSFTKIIAGAAITFFAYLGFNVITFTTADLRDPKRDLPRALYSSIGAAAVLYILIAIGVFGTLTVAEVVHYGPTAIAEAARPALGDAGFTVMAIAAVLSCTGATNATLYACDNLTGMLAEEGFFPAWLGVGSRLGRHAGLLATAVVVLIIANFVDLSAIASVGSAVSLLMFLLIGLSGWRLRRETNSRASLIVLCLAVDAIVLGFFAVDLARNDPASLIAVAAITVLSFVADHLVRARSSRAPQAGAPSAAG
jgi:amino acid transporter